MILAGLQKLSLIDYPGKIICIVFTQGCNFRCPFCHNPDLLTVQSPKTMRLEAARGVEDFFNFLQTRVGKLDGVCVTGGEPTLHPDLPQFLARIKELGFLVKLDSNGSNPQVLENVINLGLVDYIAMDIKSTPSKYQVLMGRKIDIQKIQRSVKLVMDSGVDYEFRTTCVPGLHTIQDFQEIADWISGARHYYLQEFRDLVTLDPELGQKIKGQRLDLQAIQESISHKLPFVAIRR